jgi:uncharacterized Ntn-hydrolase superfamily protein
VTFSIVARDPTTGELGVASQSHYFALGRVVTTAIAGVGAVATQSFVEPGYGPQGLALMAGGTDAPDALDQLLVADEGRALRQVAMIDALGRVGVHTGDRCVPFRGQRVGEEFVVLGNMLASERILPAMHEAFRSSSGAFAERMLDALDAGQDEGGDARGSMSASLLVVSGTRGTHSWLNRTVDLRVDESTEPLVELRRLLHLNRIHAVFGESVFTPGLVSAELPTNDAELAEALTALDQAIVALHPDPEPELWKGVLLARAGRFDEAQPLFDAVVARRPALSSFLDGLQSVEILPSPERN